LDSLYQFNNFSLYIQISGGEPTIYPRFRDLCFDICKLKTHLHIACVELTTNGMQPINLNNFKIFHNIRVSLDPFHDEKVGLEKIKENLDTFIAHAHDVQLESRVLYMLKGRALKNKHLFVDEQAITTCLVKRASRPQIIFFPHAIGFCPDSSIHSENPNATIPYDNKYILNPELLIEKSIEFYNNKAGKCQNGKACGFHALKQ